MGRERQKQKNRSSRSKVKPKIIGRTKAGKKKVNFLGNETIRDNWDRDLTLEQNYKRLGLSTRLNSSLTQPRRRKGQTTELDLEKNNDSLAIAPTQQRSVATIEEARMERDPETGRVRIVRGDKVPNLNPLNDPLNDVLDEVKPDALPNDVIQALEAQAAKEAEIEAKRKRPRQQSDREEGWVRSLIDKHGDDYSAMFRDKKLNVMQQSEGDIKRRVKKWKSKHT